MNSILGTKAQALGYEKSLLTSAAVESIVKSAVSLK